MSDTAITINEVMDFLGDSTIHKNDSLITKRDLLGGIFDPSDKFIYISLQANDLIDNYTGFDKDQKGQYKTVFNEYFSETVNNARSESYTPESTKGSYGGPLTGFAENVISAGKKYNEIYDHITNFDGDLSSIGYYSIGESEDSMDMPRIIPSSINIQEQLLNMPVPTVRSKSSGLVPDHRSKHIIHLDILYPTFESFSSSASDYPSFVNLLNMFKYMPINGILSPALSSYFLSEFTFPRLFKQLKNYGLNEALFPGISENTDQDLTLKEIQSAKFEHVLEQLGGDKVNLSEIKTLLENDDPLLDIGISNLIQALDTKAYTDSIPGIQNVEGFSKPNVSIEDLKFPIPVGFKSASVQTLQDMPGAVLARFGFSVVSSPAFPYGNIMYKDESGNPTFDAKDCEWAKRYVALASKTQLTETVDVLKVYRDQDIDSITEDTLNNLALYYYDLDHGVSKYDTNDYGSGIVLEKISGAFNSKSIEMPIMNSKFPHIQYVGVNNNSFQMMFSITNKKAIADLMALKAKVLNYENKGTLVNSSAAIENVFLNSLGICFVSPQSIALESDSDAPDLYHLTITFNENSQKYGTHEKLTLESGVIPANTLGKFKKYFYDLYKLWWHLTFYRKYYEDNGRIYPELRKNIPKLNSLMRAFGIQEDYSGRTTSSVFNPVQDVHDVEYGPIFYGIMDAYSRRTENRPFDGLTLGYFPNLISYKSLENTRGFNTTGTSRRSIVQGMIDICFGAQYYAAIPGARGSVNVVPSRAVNANKKLKELLFDQPGFDPMDRDTLFARLGETKSTPTQYLFDNSPVEVSLSTDAVNLIDMFHKAGRLIPEEVWNGAFDAIVQRKFTRGVGSDSFVSITQMDAAFLQLSSIIFQYKSRWQFDVVDKRNAHPIFADFINIPKKDRTIIMMYTRKDSSGGYYYGGYMKLDEIEEQAEKVNKFNNRKINLYEDMYCPTYRQLLLSHPKYSKMDQKEFDSAAKEWLEKFGPKYGDFGTIPVFKTQREIFDAERDPHKHITSAVSVTLENYINPDIFYVRRRDKNLMHDILSTSKEEYLKIVRETVVIQLPMNINSDYIREKYKEENPQFFNRFNQVSGINEQEYEEGRKATLAKILTDMVSYASYSMGERTQVNRNSEGVTTLARDYLMPAGEVESRALLTATKIMQAIVDTRGVQLEGENEEYFVKKTQIHFLSTENEIIGLYKWTGEKYECQLNPLLFSTKVGYSSGSGDLSLEPNDPYLHYESEERVMLHTPDMANSLLKSFPTARIYFIEEDDNSSYTQDDVYGFNDIIECSISSHIYDNDICRVKLANFGGVLSENRFSDYSYTVNYENELGNEVPVDVIDDAGERFLRRIMLRPGIPIMIKMGYGNDIDSLKTVFTGEISEVKPGEIVEIVGQGYQTELQHDYGGFYEEGIFEDIGSHHAGFYLGEQQNKKFGFLQIINFILLNENSVGIKSRNGMKHLGKSFSLYSKSKGLFGGADPRTNYEEAQKDLSRIFGESYTDIQEIKADYHGDTFNVFDSWLEKTFMGYRGRDLSRNIYVASGNNTMINYTNEWLVVNAPAIDGLREVVRYMPNFICTVVPYGRDGTLFIGDPNLPYQYREATREELKFNVKLNNYGRALRDQNEIANYNQPLNRFIARMNFEDSRLQNSLNLSTRSNTLYDNPDYREMREIFSFALYDEAKANPLPGYNQLVDMLDELMEKLGPTGVTKLLSNYIKFNIDASDYLQTLGKQDLAIGDAGENTYRFLISAFRLYFGRDYTKWSLAGTHVGNPVLNHPSKLSPNDTPTVFWNSDISQGYSVAQMTKLPYYENIFNELTNGRVRMQREGTSHKTSLKFAFAGFRTGLNYILTGENIRWIDENFANDENNQIKDATLLKLSLFKNPFDSLETTVSFTQDDGKLITKDHLIAICYFIYIAHKTYKKLTENVDQAAIDFLSENGGKKAELKYMPFNYKIYRDRHVITTEHDLIANNVIATESDMWTSVAVKVPSDTIENINGVGEIGLFTENIREGDVDRDANVYQIDSDQDFKIYPNNIAGGINFKGFRPSEKDLIENFTEINATTANLASNVVKYRLAQGLSKMYRGNLITIGRNIKPYDKITLVDNINQMYGNVMAERVIQNFSVSNGWTTTIVPCGLTNVNSTYTPINAGDLSDRFAYSFAHGDSFRYLSNLVLGVMTVSTLGFGVVAAFAGRTIAASAIGAFNVSPLGLFYRFGFVESVKKIGTRVAARFTTAGGLAGISSRFTTTAPLAAGVFYGRQIAIGSGNLFHQWYGTKMHQSLFEPEEKGGQSVLHLPCSINLLYYKNAPFLSGIEDPTATISPGNAWENVYRDLNDFFIEFSKRPIGTLPSTPDEFKPLENR